MSIFPLPVFEADADPQRRSALTDEEIYARLRPPTTIVVRFGSMRMIGEFSYEGKAKPGCGSRLVVRTPRGTEIAEMLTTTCSNSGCGKSVSRGEMLSYIESSGGRDFPFHDHGRVLRVAEPEDLALWASIRATSRDLLGRAKEIAARHRVEGDPPMKLVEAEPIFGGELLTIYYLSEERIDFRTLLGDLAADFGTRIEMRHIGARDEARLVADYERCGQHCCCKGFLKVLKPVSIKSAKTQKATLDPLKISGRCGRLMCCLRYEDQTYEELKKRLPRLKSRVGTSEGPGLVVDTKILVQLVLVRLEADGQELAVPVEELMDPDDCPAPQRAAARSSNRTREAANRAAPATQRRGAVSAAEGAQPPEGAARPTQKGAQQQRRDGADAPPRRDRPQAEGGAGPSSRSAGTTHEPREGPGSSAERSTPQPPPEPQPEAHSEARPAPAPESSTPAEPNRRRRRRRRGRGQSGEPPASER